MNFTNSSFPFPFLLFFFPFFFAFNSKDQEGMSEASRSRSSFASQDFSATREKKNPRVARTERKFDASHTPTFLAITIIMVLGRGSKRRGRWIVSASWVRVHVAGVLSVVAGRRRGCERCRERPSCFLNFNLNHTAAAAVVLRNKQSHE